MSLLRSHTPSNVKRLSLLNMKRFTGKYAVRSGVYPSVFANDAAFGLMPSELTLAQYLKQEGWSVMSSQLVNGQVTVAKHLEMRSKKWIG